MRASDIVVAFLAIALFGAFLGVLIWKVPSPPLILVCLLGLGLAAFDFIQTGIRHRATRRRPGGPQL